VTPPDRHQPTASARAATWLLGLFLVAILGALGVTVDEVPGARVVALAAVVPIILLTAVFIAYSRRGRPWAYAGGSAVGTVGVALRIAVSTQPSLEVGGGLPIEVTALYLFLGVSVVVTNLVAALASGHASTVENRGR
jgi:hypothetical protein